MSKLPTVFGVPLSLALSAGLLLGPACAKKDQDARLFEACSPDRPCAEPNLCLSFTDDPKRGYCLKMCAKDAECPAGLRCTGRFGRTEGTADTYCRRPTVGLGGDCRKPGAGCKKGLRCFDGKCRTACKDDAQCTDAATRCVPILVDSLTAAEQKHLYSVCLPASRTDGQACSDVGPFCARDHYCYDKKCLQGCKTDKDCGKRRICDGQIYFGPDADKRARAKAKPDRMFCRKTAKRNRPCHHNLHLTCERGLTCVKFHCRKVRTVGLGGTCDPDRAVYCKKGSVCYKSRCRRTCLGDDDCPRGKGDEKDQECNEKLIRKRKIMICL